MATASPKRRQLGIWPSLVMAVAVCLSFVAASAGPAAAAPDLAAATRTAERVWPSVPLRCHLVGLEVSLLSLLNLDASAEAYYSSCRVRIAPEIMRSASDLELCSLMVHEYGHLAGLPDSTDPNSVMYPKVGPNANCESSGPSPADTAENALQTRREKIADTLVRLRERLRDAKRARDHAHGARRTRLTKKVKRLESRVNRLKRELKNLPPL
jgi:hypothetical protein